MVSVVTGQRHKMGALTGQLLLREGVLQEYLIFEYNDKLRKDGDLWV